MSPIRVLLTDDHEIVLDSLSVLLATMPDVEVVGTFLDARRVVPFLETDPTLDVVLTDQNMPLLNGIDLTLQIRQRFPKVKVLMLTVSEDVDSIRAAFNAGISGYVMKKAGRAELEKALKTVARGEKYFSEAVLFGLMNPGPSTRLRDEVPPEPIPLTERELDVIRLIAQELSTTEIAERLFISPGTVETHRHNILRKLGVKNAIGIIKYALKYGLVERG
jgi:DNA-binding NarL/FixJ family response regulator